MPEELELLAAILSAARPGHFWLTIAWLATERWYVSLHLGNTDYGGTADRREEAIRACHDWLAARGYFDGPALAELPEEPATEPEGADDDGA